MDPASHLILPLLILLAARLDARLVVPLSIFAILPDLDSLLGPHRMVLHNVFIIVVIPLAFILIARWKRPSLVLPGLIVLFYLGSHILLDLGGVALLYPFYDGAFYFVPHLDFYTAPSIGFNFIVEWGVRTLEPTTYYTFVSSLGFTFVLFFAVMLVLFRKETLAAMKSCRANTKHLLAKLRKIVIRDRGQ